MAITRAARSRRAWSRRHAVALGVHDVVLDGPGDGPEGGQTDGQVDRAHVGAGRLAAVEDAPGQVESGRGGRDRAGLVGVDRLVALGVRQRLVDVRREGDAPTGGQDIIAVGEEADAAPAVREPFAHLHGVAP